MKETFYLKKRKKRGYGSKFLIIIVLLGLAYLIYHYTPFFVKNPINVNIKYPTKYFSSDKSFDINIKDTKFPLKEINIYAYVMDTNVSIYNKVFEHKDTYEVPLKFKLNQKIPDGQMRLVVEVSDYAHNNFSMGFKRKTQEELTVYNEYPKVILLNDFASVLEGGSAVVLFYANDKIGLSDVYLQVKYADNKVAKFRAFKANNLTNHNNTYIAFFTYPFCQQKNWDTSIVATNNADNKIYVHVPVYYESFRNRIEKNDVTKKFIETKVYRILQENHINFSKSDPAQAFDLVINKVEKENNHQIKSICDSANIDKMLFSGPFLQLPHSAVMAYFGDYRTFYFDGRPLVNEYHMGVDFASIEHAKVPAANSGQVIFTGKIGVYGRCIIIDNGLGIYSLYGHLEDFLVQKGQFVQKGQIIAHTDTTGLAVGDHLHFSIMIDGYYVNPIEWLDSNWLMDNVYKKITNAKKRADLLKYYISQ